ncbi:serine hydrolase domain-containing protein, partial [Cnuella takakiae]
RKLSFDFAPGTNHQYSGEGFEYLRKALENKFGKSLEALCDTLVFKPLKMYDSRLTWKDNLEARFAKWHDQAGKNTYETFKSTKPNAADDLLTTVEDYSKFAMAVLSGFNLPDSLFKDMITPRATISKNSSMCLGWEYFGSLPNGEYAILHTGSDLGVKTLVLLFPRSKQGLVVFTNSDNGHLLYEKLIPLALGKLGETFMKTAF